MGHEFNSWFHALASTLWVYKVIAIVSHVFMSYCQCVAMFSLRGSVECGMIRYSKRMRLDERYINPTHRCCPGNVVRTARGGYGIIICVICSGWWLPKCLKERTMICNVFLVAKTKTPYVMRIGASSLEGSNFFCTLFFSLIGGLYELDVFPKIQHGLRYLRVGISWTLRANLFFLGIIRYLSCVVVNHY